MPSRRRAFTLVELLVVVGIISVLIAILMPALSRARDHANRVRCAANLRSVGHALTTYTQRYGYYPGGHIRPGNDFIWPVRLRPYLDGNRNVFHCPSQDDWCRWTDDAPGLVFPAPPYYVTLGYEPGERVIGWDTLFSYGYNNWGSGGEPYSGRGLGDVVHPSIRNTQAGASPQVRSSRVKVPAETVAVADSTVDGRYDSMIRPNANAPYTLPGSVHGAGANVLFCDGHVSWHRQRELTLPPRSDPTFPQKARIWNYDQSSGLDD